MEKLRCPNCKRNFIKDKDCMEMKMSYKEYPDAIIIYCQKCAVKIAKDLDKMENIRNSK